MRLIASPFIGISLVPVLLLLLAYPFTSVGLPQTISCYKPLCSFKTGFKFEEDSKRYLYLPITEPISYLNYSCLKLRDHSESYCGLSHEDHLLIIDAPPNLFSNFDGKGADVVVDFWNPDTNTEHNNDSDIAHLSNANKVFSKTYNVNSQFGSYFGVLSNGAENLSPNKGFVELVSPPFGTISTNRFTIEFYAHNKAIPLVQVKILGIAQFVVPSYQSSLSSESSNPIEPASWFIELGSLLTSADSPLLSAASNDLYSSRNSNNKVIDDLSDQEISGPITAGYIEFVLNETEIRNQRVFSTDSKKYLEAKTGPYSISGSTIDSEGNNVIANDASADLKNESRKHICIWASNVMDGQKIIWLNQIKHMDETRFKFTWILTLSDNEKVRLDEITEKMVVYHIQKLNGESNRAKADIVLSPFTNLMLQIDELYDAPADGSEPFLTIDSDFNLNNMYRYVAKRMRISNYNVDALTPQWVKTLCLSAIQYYKKVGCDLITFGNNRDSSSDSLITETARAYGIPTVSELLNLFADPWVTPDAVVSPSLYALTHPSTAELLSTPIPELADAAPGTKKRHRLSNSLTPRAIIISPGVDAQHFFQELPHPRSPRYLTFNNCPTEGVDKCFVIGFMARLAPEKNPGLFILFAHHYHLMNPLARFIVIGDGLIRKQVADLSFKLGLKNIIYFAGWKSDDLKDYLSSIDVIVNPSLRGWSETFCIANVEAMSMSIPIVTFAVGGVGEYVSGVVVSDHGDYTVTENAIIVNRAAPEAISNAVDLLYKDEKLREALGNSSRITVLKSFTIQQQISKYTDLYNSLIHEYEK